MKWLYIIVSSSPVFNQAMAWPQFQPGMITLLTFILMTWWVKIDKAVSLSWGDKPMNIVKRFCPIFLKDNRNWETSPAKKQNVDKWKLNEEPWLSKRISENLRSYCDLKCNLLTNQAINRIDEKERKKELVGSCSYTMVNEIICSKLNVSLFPLLINKWVSLTVMTSIRNQMWC